MSAAVSTDDAADRSLLLQPVQPAIIVVTIELLVLAGLPAVFFASLSSLLGVAAG